MLRLYQSNHMRVLASLFCEHSQHNIDPMVPTTVVVQSFGIGQWLKLQLAEQQGISAHLDCVLPATCIWRQYRSLLPETALPDESPFDRERLAWRLMRLIPDTDHEPLKRYLDMPGDPDIRLFQLSFQIAQVFDQYLMYRPNWPLAWEQGKPLPDIDNPVQRTWQVSLWQKILADKPGISELHRANLHQQLLKRIAEKPTLPSGQGNTLFIFGLSSIAPIQLETFSKLSEIMDVNVYFLNPCQHYWGDIVSPRDKARRSVRKLLGTEGELTEQDYLTVGNPLLGSLGKQGREYLELLLEDDAVVASECFLEHDSESILAIIKNDILNLEYGGGIDESPAHKHSPDSADHSLQVHSTHSRMREVEILYDQLLSIFDNHGDIEPKDVVVMAPDISIYAPFINTVFKDKIHFSIADRTLIQQSTLIASFFNIIALPHTRLTSVEVMDLLEVPGIARRFDLDEDEINRIATWIDQTGIRWEFDGEMKSERWELPAENMNTWRFGLDRMLLGYAMDSGEGLYADRLPYDLDAADGELLGTLCHIVDQLMQTREILSQPHDASTWRDILNRILREFFDPNESETLEINQLQSIMDRLQQDTEAAGYTDRFSSQLIQYWLEQQLSPEKQSPGFITGGITFATLVPMRSIPFEVVCLLGMNDADFPRESRPVSFDLMHIHGPRKGDRSRRTDDRYLFLEALLSARRIFYISYEGKGTRDNQVRPPATTVSELLEYISGIYPDFSVTEHPLQPFSHRYFNGELTSYQRMWYDALYSSREKAPFIQHDLELRQELNAESMEQLVAFFRNPAQYYFQHCLGVYFDYSSIELKESESFVLDSLENYSLTDLALKNLISGGDEDEWQRRLLASGMLMNNSLGRRYLDQQTAIARSIHNELIERIGYEEPVSVRETLNIDGRKLSITVPGLYAEKHIDLRPGTLRKRQLVEVWIRHLCLNASGHELPTLMISKGSQKPAVSGINPLPATEAIDILGTLLEHYDTGIRKPLNFLPECSYAYFKAMNSGKSREQALQASLDSWQDDYSMEPQNPYWQRLAEADELFNGAFEQAAMTVYESLTQYQCKA